MGLFVVRCEYYFDSSEMRANESGDTNTTGEGRYVQTLLGRLIAHAEVGYNIGNQGVWRFMSIGLA
jgi:hypothetical protein